MNPIDAIASPFVEQDFNEPRLAKPKERDRLRYFEKKRKLEAEKNNEVLQDC